MTPSPQRISVPVPFPVTIVDFGESKTRASAPIVAKMCRCSRTSRPLGRLDTERQGVNGLEVL
jgi:hypothetical protein